MLIVSVLALVCIVVIVNFVRGSGVPQSVTTYETLVVTSNVDPLCPGEDVTWHQVAHYTNTPVVLRRVLTVWSLDKNRTVVDDQLPSYRNYWEPITTAIDGDWTIPDDFKPGQYQVRFSTTAEGRRSEMFIVPFTVKEGC